MPKLTYFNSLPPKKEYLEALREILSSQGVTMSQLQSRSGLTKTQVGCALEVMLRDGEARRAQEKGKYFYFSAS